MPYTPPTTADLQRYATDLNLRLDPAALERLAGVMPAIDGTYAHLDALAEQTPPVRPGPRRHWTPAPQDNPLGGWVTRTEIPGAATGPLAGRTLAVKDVIFVAGVPTTGGTDFLAGFVPEFDAPIVDRALAAGAIVTGKAACEYFCCTGGSSTGASGLVRNPHRPDHCTGGSSSGSAALVAGGAVDMALGTDNGGSVRIPASICGAVGMKATAELVPYSGVLRMDRATDYAGPITTNVADNARLLEVIAGPDDGAPWCGRAAAPYSAALWQSTRGLRIGVLREGFDQPGSDPVVDGCVHAAADRYAALGAVVSEVSIPEHLDALAVWAGVISEGIWHMFRNDGVLWNVPGATSPSLQPHLARWREALAGAPASLHLFALVGRHLEATRGRYYGKCMRLIPWLRQCYAQRFADVDVLLLPTTRMRARPLPASQAALTFDQVMADTFDFAGNTAQFNITGHPAISLPCGLRDGLPVGLQLVGRHFEEATLYRAAHAFEQAGDWREL